MSESWTLLRLSPIAQERYVNHMNDILPDMEIYFPTYQKLTRPHRCRHPIPISLPVYPGYLFARIDLETSSTRKLVSTPIRAYFVRFGSSISIVPNSVIEDLKLKESLNLLMKEDTIQDPYHPGRKIRIHLPVASIDGIIVQLMGPTQLLVDTRFGQWRVPRRATTLA